jgi:predicted integral membrane protein DUF2269
VETVLAVTFYQLVVFVHVVAVVVAFGPTFAFGVIQATAERLHPRSLPFALTVIKRISQGMVIPVAVVVGATGIYQAIDGPFEFDDDQWMSIGLALYLVLLGLALWVYRPSVMDRAIAAAQRSVEAAGPDRQVELSDDYRAIMRVPNATGPILGLIVVVIVYLMEVKPFTG